MGVDWYDGRREEQRAEGAGSLCGKMDKSALRSQHDISMREWDRRWLSRLGVLQQSDLEGIALEHHSHDGLTSNVHAGRFNREERRSARLDNDKYYDMPECTRNEGLPDR